MSSHSGDGSRLPNGGNTRVGQRGSGHLAAFSVCLVQRFRNSNHIALIVGRAKSPGATDVTTLGDRAILPTLHMISFMESVV